ncbi:50S ribosomal protein L25/general stress protein Ctc [Algiphilus sp. W345]|uniref:Large ribosomal subunit protein bL25 n=1 Tax=Banduia mediterranea TaxID=3075609 RepID=A0ABU2WKK7_9GAMM|nr:50S ribosomal protein L25/general stress protein Ctc [Algiphilus sp. W345]MDT0497592.1 50S ribosomal protein L25/general stress protein Ctc [Algiphilus sp. W345]
MSENFIVNAEVRDAQGTSASRRLRRAGRVPAIIYGGDLSVQQLSVEHRELAKHLETEAFYSHVLTIKVGDKEEQAVLKDLQRHPAKPIIMHADFLRVRNDQTIRMHVPVHFKGAEIAVGVKTGGGLLEHLVNEIEVECLPQNLPEFIEIDVTQLNVGESVHMSELTLPEGVELVELKHGNDAAVAAIHLPRISAADDAGDPAEGGEEGEAS